MRDDCHAVDSERWEKFDQAHPLAVEKPAADAHVALALWRAADLAVRGGARGHFLDESVEGVVGEVGEGDAAEAKGRLKMAKVVDGEAVETVRLWWSVG